MLGEITNIANLGVESTPGECSYRVLRMANSQYEEAEYPVGTIFQIEWQGSSGKMHLIDPDGDRIFAPAGEAQCFEEVDSFPKLAIAPSATIAQTLLKGDRPY